MLRNFLVNTIVGLACVLILFFNASGQEVEQSTEFDTIRITPESVIIFKDSIMIPKSDTVIIINKKTKYKIRKNPYKRSADFYDSIYYKTDRKKLLKEMYGLLLRHKPQDETMASAGHVKADEPFLEYQGKTISSVRFVQVDVLEGSVDDTLKFAVSGVGVFMNKTHINTRPWVLKNYMLVKQGDEVIPGIVSDNERVIRDLPGIEDARIEIVPDPENENNVQLIVVTKDKFPLGIGVSVSSFNKFNLGVVNNNTFGWDYELGGRIFYDANFSPSWGYEFKTGYRNIMGSFIGANISYINAFSTRGIRLEFAKEFLTPLTKYGGELKLGWMDDSYEIESDDTLIEGIYNINYQDVWAGRSILLGGRDSRKNLIFSFRYQREYYKQRPYVSTDSNINFHNRQIYLGKIAYSKLNYYKSRLIRSFGNSENIPYGMTCGITYGYMDDEFFGRVYLGANIGAGKYFQGFGYLAGSIVTGAFFQSGIISQGLFEASMIYYTPIIKINRYASRHLLFTRYRGATTFDANNKINFEEAIQNLNQENIEGISTITANYEFALFAPWYFYSFRFAPYAFADLGLISGSRNVFKKNDFFSALGLGIRLGNESLVCNSIGLAVGYLPRRTSDQSAVFFEFSIGINPWVEMLEVEKPHILRREVFFPF